MTDNTIKASVEVAVADEKPVKKQRQTEPTVQFVADEDMRMYIEAELLALTQFCIDLKPRFATDDNNDKLLLDPNKSVVLRVHESLISAISFWYPVEVEALSGKPVEVRRFGRDFYAAFTHIVKAVSAIQDHLWKPQDGYYEEIQQAYMRLVFARNRFVRILDQFDSVVEG